jgi:hypothetical protein
MNIFDDDVKVIRFLDNYRGVLTGECFFTSGTIVDTENAPVEIDHSGLVEAERAEYVEGEELGDSWIFDPNQVVEVETEEAEKAEEIGVDDLKSLSLKELKATCKELGLKRYSRLKADELIELINSVSVPVEEEAKKAEGE